MIRRSQVGSSDIIKEVDYDYTIPYWHVNEDLWPRPIRIYVSRGMLGFYPRDIIELSESALETAMLTEFKCKIFKIIGVANGKEGLYHLAGLACLSSEYKETSKFKSKFLFLDLRFITHFNMANRVTLLYRPDLDVIYRTKQVQ